MRTPLSWVRRLSQLPTVLYARLFGRQVGSDGHGQRYFCLRSKDWAGRESRVVLYAGEPEASRIPPQWRAWLHHMGDQALPASNGDCCFWIRSPVPNLTGTGAAFLPQGHVLQRLSCGGRDLRVTNPGVWSPPA